MGDPYAPPTQVPPLKTMSRFMNSSMTCLHSTNTQTLGPVMMNPVLRKI